MWKQHIKAKRYRDGRFQAISEQLLIDRDLTVSLNGKKVVTLSTSSRQQQELALGYLATNGHIDCGMTDIAIDTETPSTINVQTASSAESAWPLSPTPPFIPDPKLILIQMANYQDQAVLYRDTGIAHSVGLFNGAECLHFCEDLDHVNAWYKLVGAVLHNSTDRNEAFVICSGPICAEIIALVKGLGVWTVVSRVGMTSRAQDQASKLGITPIIFARGKQFTTLS